MQTSDDPFYFFFLVDRSGSMEGKRIDMAKEAMLLFLQSLPTQCFFEIISFGTSYDLLNAGVSGGQIYSHQNLERAKKAVQAMSANMGGTEILQPMHAAIQIGDSQKWVVGRNFKTRIFLLTDGDVSSP